jgi:hypothetical protein
MRTFKYAPLFAFFLLLTAGPVGAEEAAQAKPYLSATSTMSSTAKVEAIDHKTRVVTLRAEDGSAVTFTASEDAHNLDQVGVGDIVTADYVQDFTMQLLAAEQATPGSAGMEAIARAEKGDKPGMVAIETEVEVTTVEAINIEANTFKLKWADGTVKEYTARNPENLKAAAVGDVLVITYSQALAVSVDKAPAKN